MTSQERLLEMESNERNALKAFMDKSDEATSAERQRLKDNWEIAEQKLTTAQINGLNQTSGDLDSAVGKLKTANAEAKLALDTITQISELLKKLEKATELAGKVLLAAAAV